MWSLRFARNAGQVTTSANKDLFKAYNTTQAWPTPMQIQNN